MHKTKNVQLPIHNRFQILTVLILHTGTHACDFTAHCTDTCDFAGTNIKENESHDNVMEMYGNDINVMDTALLEQHDVYQNYSRNSTDPCGQLPVDMYGTIHENAIKDGLSWLFWLYT